MAQFLQKKGKSILHLWTDHLIIANFLQNEKWNKNHLQETLSEKELKFPYFN